MNTDIGLSESLKKDLIAQALSRGDTARAEQIRKLGLDLDLSSGQLNANIGNADKAFDRSQDYFNDRRGDLVAGRGMATEDFNRGVDQYGRENADDLLGFDLKNIQYDKGAAQQAQDLAVKGNALDRIGRAGQDAFGNAVSFGQMGGQYANQAAKGYGQSLDKEAANAGWGTKLLTNLGMTALSAAIPGAGGVAGAGGGGLGGLVQKAGGALGGLFGKKQVPAWGGGF